MIYNEFPKNPTLEDLSILITNNIKKLFEIEKNNILIIKFYADIEKTVGIRIVIKKYKSLNEINFILADFSLIDNSDGCNNIGSPIIIENKEELINTMSCILAEQALLVHDMCIKTKCKMEIESSLLSINVNNDEEFNKLTNSINIIKTHSDLIIKEPDNVNTKIIKDIANLSLYIYNIWKVDHNPISIEIMLKEPKTITALNIYSNYNGATNLYFINIVITGSEEIFTSIIKTKNDFINILDNTLSIVYDYYKLLTNTPNVRIKLFNRVLGKEII